MYVNIKTNFGLNYHHFKGKLARRKKNPPTSYVDPIPSGLENSNLSSFRIKVTKYKPRTPPFWKKNVLDLRMSMYSVYSRFFQIITILDEYFVMTSLRVV